MSNTFLTPSVIAKESLRILVNNLQFANLVHREYKKEFVKVGDTVTIRKPNKFYAASGATRVDQGITEPSTSITVDQQKHVSWSWNSKDLTMTIAEYSERYLKPALVPLANAIDVSLAGLYPAVWNHLGTPGTTPTTLSALTSVMARMTHEAVPMDRKAVLSPDAYYGMVSGDFKGFYSTGMTEDAAKRGLIDMGAGMKMYDSANIANHTAGTVDSDTDTVLINADSSSWTPAEGDTSIWVDGFAAGQNTKKVFLAGDVITIAGCYAVNPVSFQKLPYLRDFTITADVTWTHATGFVEVNVSPPIISTAATGNSKPFARINALPVDNAAVTVKSGEAGAISPQNMFFHKSAFALVTCPLDLPDSATFKARETYEGISLRIIKAYDIDNDVEKIRVDVLYGVAAMYPDLAVRYSG